MAGLDRRFLNQVMAITDTEAENNRVARALGKDSYHGQVVEERRGWKQLLQ